MKAVHKNVLKQFNNFKLSFMKFSYISTSRMFIQISKNNFSDKNNKVSDNNDIHKDFQPEIKTNLSTMEDYMKFIDSTIKSNKVCVFMKGTKEMPRCGFSNYMIQVLKFYKLPNIKDVNVLESTELREAVKQYSSWPTYPQLYINGELIGGCDIIKQMHESGELESLLKTQQLI